VIAVNRTFKPPICNASGRLSGATADPTGASTIPHIRRSTLSRETAIAGPWGAKGYTEKTGEGEKKSAQRKG